MLKIIRRFAVNLPLRETGVLTGFDHHSKMWLICRQNEIVLAEVVNFKSQEEQHYPILEQKVEFEAFIENDQVLRRATNITGLNGQPIRQREFL